jgi:hypothetical protein
MPVLPNPKHELMAAGLPRGLGNQEAHKPAGYKPNRFHASRLETSANIRQRVAEIQTESLQKQTERRVEIGRSDRRAVGAGARQHRCGIDAQRRSAGAAAREDDEGRGDAAGARGRYERARVTAADDLAMKAPVCRICHKPHWGLCDGRSRVERNAVRGLVLRVPTDCDHAFRLIATTCTD